MSEIKPMLLTEMEFTPDVWAKFGTWLFQEKENGIRAIGHFKNGKMTSMRGRRNNTLLHLFPEFTQLKLNEECDAILDGEVIVADEKGRSMFYGGINQRDKKLHPENVPKFPITFVVFDVLYLKGQVVVDKPYSERLALIQTLFSDTANMRVVKNIENPKEYWENKVVKENREGLVIKNPNGKYEVDTRSKNNLKLKFYKIAQVIVDALENNPKGVKVSGHTADGLLAEVQWSSSGFENIKIGDTIPVEYLDVVNNKMVQPHKVKGMVI
jgi:bifunctional non-homologous end joining protein LigD